MLNFTFPSSIVLSAASQRSEVRIWLSPFAKGRALGGVPGIFI